MGIDEKIATRYQVPLTELEEDPRFQRLCALQIRELTEITGRHAVDRVQLLLDIRKQKEGILGSRWATISKSNKGESTMFPVSSNGSSHDTQVADALSYLKHNHKEEYNKVIVKFPETLIFDGSWLDTEAMGVDVEYSSWLCDAIEETSMVEWIDGEPFALSENETWEEALNREENWWRSL